MISDASLKLCEIQDEVKFLKLIEQMEKIERDRHI